MVSSAHFLGTGKRKASSLDLFDEPAELAKLLLRVATFLFCLKVFTYSSFV